VIPRLAKELHNELPEEKRFSERNIGRMIFFRAYPRPDDFLPQAVAKLELPAESILWSIPWGHHALLMEKLEQIEAELGKPSQGTTTAKTASTANGRPGDRKCK